MESGALCRPARRDCFRTLGDVQAGDVGQKIEKEIVVVGRRRRTEGSANLVVRGAEMALVSFACKLICPRSAILLG